MLPARSHFDIVAIEILGRVSSFFPPLHRRIFFLLKKKKNLFIWLHWVLVQWARSLIFSHDIWNLVPWPGLETRPPALGTRTVIHWATREVPDFFLLCATKDIVSLGYFIFLFYWFKLELDHLRQILLDKCF